MSASDYLELKVLDHLLGGGDYTRPATVYIALFTATPNDAGGGTEVTGGSYARLSVTNNNTNFPAAASGAKSNGTTFTFVTPTVSWGTVTSFAIFDAVTSGNMLIYGNLSANRTINTGDIPKFNIGDLTITCD